MGDLLFDRLRSDFRGRILRGEPLSRHTTWRVGGAADLFLAPADREDLRGVLKVLSETGTPWFILGAGSNLLVRDGGIRGAVIHLGALRHLVFGAGGEVLAGGGLPLMTLIRETARRGLAGLEGLAGIPGTVGGGVVMNAGAGGQEISGVLRDVSLVACGAEETRPAPSLGLGYRSSFLRGDRIVVEGRFVFRAGDPVEIEREVRSRLTHRRSAHAVRAPNAGSVFKNPPGASAWRLIDEAGFRGVQEGGAQVSPAHCNFIVNRGGARAQDILTLMDRIRAAVFRRTGIDLEPEVRIIGED